MRETHRHEGQADQRRRRAPRAAGSGAGPSSQANAAAATRLATNAVREHPRRVFRRGVRVDAGLAAPGVLEQRPVPDAAEDERGHGRGHDGQPVDRASVTPGGMRRPEHTPAGLPCRHGRWTLAADEGGAGCGESRSRWSLGLLGCLRRRHGPGAGARARPAASSASIACVGDRPRPAAGFPARRHRPHGQRPHDRLEGAVDGSGWWRAAAATRRAASACCWCSIPTARG